MPVCLPHPLFFQGVYHPNKRLTGRNTEVRTTRRWLTVIAAAAGLLIAGSPAIAAVPAAASTSSQASQAASGGIHWPKVGAL